MNKKNIAGSEPVALPSKATRDARSLPMPYTKRIIGTAYFITGLLFLALLCFESTARAAGWDLSSNTTTTSYSSESGGLGNYAALPFLVSVSARGGYDDNVSTTHINPQESAFTNVGVTLSYTFGSPRTRLDLSAGGGVTYYFENVGSDNYDTNGYLSFSLTHKASPRLILAVTAYAAYQEEPDFSLALGLNRRSGNYFYTQDKGTVTYLWTPRFSTATSYTLGVVRYDSSSIGFFEDRFENTVGNEFRFLLWPTTTVVAEYRFEMVSYDNINRDSTTHFALVGFDHSFNPRLDASFRGGAEFRDYDAFGKNTSPYFEGTLSYAVGKDTSVAWTNRYAIEEADVLLNPSRTTFRTGLRAKHNFTSRISALLGAFYEHDAYDSINMPPIVSSGFNEETFDVAISLRYAFNRYFGIEAGYAHTEVLSDVFLREYSRNRFFGGLNLTF